MEKICVRRSLLPLWFALAAGPGLASAQPQPGAMLYELTENMQLDAQNGVVFRTAIAALQGSAKLGTPLCPMDVLVTNPKAQTCTVTAVGTDSIDIATGKGSVSGNYAVVVQGDNPVDPPEFVAQIGTFHGDIDLSPTLSGIPLGFITNGELTVEMGGVPVLVFPFAGTFQLPFAMSSKGKPEKPRRGRDAFYLGTDGRLIPVRPNELSLGIATVRLELFF